MPYAPIIPLIMRAGLGPSITLAHFSEVTQGKVGGEGGEKTRGGRERQKLISYVFSLVLRSKWVRNPPTHPIPHVSPQINNNPHCPPPTFLPTSPLYSGGETTDFLPAPSVCFSKRQCTSIYHFSMFRMTAALRATLSNQSYSFQKMLSSLVSLIYSFCVLPRHRLPLVCCWLTVRCCQASTSGAA